MNKIKLFGAGMILLSLFSITCAEKEQSESDGSRLDVKPTPGDEKTLIKKNAADLPASANGEFKSKGSFLSKPQCFTRSEKKYESRFCLYHSKLPAGVVQSNIDTMFAGNHKIFESCLLHQFALPGRSNFVSTHGVLHLVLDTDLRVSFSKIDLLRGELNVTETERCIKNSKVAWVMDGIRSVNQNESILVPFVLNIYGRDYMPPQALKTL